MSNHKNNRNSGKENCHNNNKFPEILNFNLNAAEYKPKEKIEEEVREEFDMIMGDIIESEVQEEFAKQIKLNNSLDDESEDEEKWFPKYKDCPCCNGFVYNCNGEACISLGQCYCKMKDDIEEDSNQMINEKKPEMVKN